MIDSANSTGFRSARLESAGRRNQEAMLISPPLLERIELRLRPGFARAGWKDDLVMASFVESFLNGPGDYVVAHTERPARSGTKGRVAGQSEDCAVEGHA